MVARKEIDISIIFPLIFVRGPIQRAIDSWTRLQRIARQRYEVIVVSPGGDRTTEDLIRSRLTHADRFVDADTDDLYTLYDIGIQHSRGRIVMITESHVVATRGCLLRVMEALEQSQYEAACCNALPPSKEGYLATMEAMLFAEESNQWIPEGSWRRVHERGFAIYRRTYNRLGGFPYEYGWFAGRAFAARLHAAAVPVAYLPDARVVHFNSVKNRDIVEGARSFTYGELLHRDTESEDHVTRYFGPSGALEARELYRRPVAITALRDTLYRLVREGPGLYTLRAAADFSLKAMFGFAIPIAIMRVKACIALAKVAALRPWGPAAGLNAYREYWHRHLVRRFQLEYCRDSVPPACNVGNVVSAGGTQSGLTGFHQIEYIDGEPFQWIGPVAIMRIRICQPVARVQLEAHPIGPPLVRRGLAIYFDGTGLELEFEQPFVASASIKKETEEDSTHTLLITSKPLPGVHDPRARGIPFLRLWLTQTSTAEK